MHLKHCLQKHCLNSFCLALFGVDLPELPRILLANQGHGTVHAAALVLLHDRGQVLALVQVPQEVEPKAKPVALHLRRIHPTGARSHLLWIEAAPRAKDLVPQPFGDNVANVILIDK